MNRLKQLFQTKTKNIVSIYFTAGYPNLNDTCTIIKELEQAGADLIEIGIPFSDPMADGVVIQESGSKALQNGMSLKLLFEQLKDIRKEVKIPLIMMGYLNPVFRFGIENFCEKCKEVGIDGVIVPDLPLDVYTKEYQTVFEKNGLSNIFLISPQTTDERIRLIDSVSNGFIYMVSSSATTGAKSTIQSVQEEYFKRIESMNLNNPRLIGFGISNHETFKGACQYANGAIIGSAFIKALSEPNKGLPQIIKDFVKGIKGE